MIELPLDTDRLEIRRFAVDDREPFIEFVLDDDSTRYLAFAPEQRTADGAGALMDYVIASYDSAERIDSYVIADRETGSYVGSCGFSPYSDGVVEIYYTVSRPHWGNGIGTEATRCMIDALSRSPGINEIRAFCHPENIAAHRVALAAGMRASGAAIHKDSGLDAELFITTI